MAATTNNPTATQDGLWDATDVARYLKVSRSWVYHRAEAGQLPSLRVGGLVRFDPDVVIAYARGEIEPAKLRPPGPDRQRCARQSKGS